MQLKPDLVSAKAGLLAGRLINPQDRASAKTDVYALAGQVPGDYYLLALLARVLGMDGKTAESNAALSKAIALKPYAVELHAAMIGNSISLKDYSGAATQIQVLQKLAPRSVSVSYFAGLAAYNQGDMAVAKENLQRCVSSAPDFLPCAEVAALVALNMGEISTAERLAKVIISKDPELIAGPKLLAVTYLAMNSPERALLTLSPLLKPTGTPAALLALAGEALLRTGDTKKGIQFLDAAAAASNDAADLKVAAASARIGIGDASGIQMLESLGSQTGNGQELTIARSFIGAKRYDRAIEIISSFMKASPKDPAGPAALGNVYLASGRADEAAKWFASALTVQPNYLPAAQALSDMDFRAGKIAEAKARYTTLLATDPKNVSAILSLAKLTAVSGGAGDSVLALYKQAIEANPVSPLAAMEQARYLIQSGQAPKAVALLEPVAVVNAADITVTEALASAYDANGEYGKAVTLLDKALESNGTSAPLNVKLGSLRLKLSDSKGAIENFKRAQELQPNAIEPKAALAGTLYYSGQRAEGIAQAKAIQTESPINPIGYALLGEFLGSEGKPQDALAQFKKAFDLEKNPATAFKLYRAMYIANQVPEAKAFLRSWWAGNPTDTRTMIQASELQLEKGEWKEAVTVLNEVLKVDKNSTPALNNAAVAMHQLKEPKALQLAQRAYQLEPENFSILDTYGWILLEQGKLDEALSVLTTAYSKAPKNAEVMVHLAQVYAKKGDATKSQELARNALQYRPSADIKAKAELLLK